jgi:AhpD family alkylhydroperoxidase
MSQDESAAQVPARRRAVAVDRQDLRDGTKEPEAPATKGAARAMATVPMIEYAEASPEVRAVYDDIMATRQTDRVNNFWKVIANHPPTLRRTWESLKEVMAPGALDPLTKEMVYLAVSAASTCEYCIRSHTASARRAGMTEAMLGELMAVAAMASETNRLATAYQVEVDEALRR